MTEAAQPRDEKPIAVFRYDRKRIILYLTLLAGMFVLALGELLRGPKGFGNFAAVVFLLAIAVYVGYDMLGKLRRREPALIVERHGIVDQREQRILIAWHEIVSASIKRRFMARNVRLELDGNRVVEIDMSLIEGKAADLVKLISREARRALADGR